MCGLRSAVGIGEQQVIVLCGFGAEGDSEFLGRAYFCSGRHEGQFEIPVALLPILKVGTRIVDTAVVHNNHFKLGIVLREQGLQVVAEVTFLISGAHNNTHSRLLYRRVCSIHLTRFGSQHSGKDIAQVEVHLVQERCGKDAEYYLFCQ